MRIWKIASSLSTIEHRWRRSSSADLAEAWQKIMERFEESGWLAALSSARERIGAPSFQRWRDEFTKFVALRQAQSK
jgi:hypothetical protein